MNSTYSNNINDISSKISLTNRIINHTELTLSSSNLNNIDNNFNQIELYRNHLISHLSNNEFADNLYIQAHSNPNIIGNNQNLCSDYNYNLTNSYDYFENQSSNLNIPRRKNATRESANTLKAWLQNNLKHPYPSKDQKVMLAIITNMSLTQVSTWFANARRRLKKENKMTWLSKSNTDDDNSSENDDNDNIKSEQSTLKIENNNSDLIIPTSYSSFNNSNIPPTSFPDNHILPPYMIPQEYSTIQQTPYQFNYPPPPPLSSPLINNSSFYLPPPSSSHQSSIHNLNQVLSTDLLNFNQLSSPPSSYCTNQYNNNSNYLYKENFNNYDNNNDGNIET